MFKRKKRHRLPRRSAQETWRNLSRSVTGWVGWILLLPFIGLYWLYERAKGEELPEPEPEPEPQPELDLPRESLIPPRSRTAMAIPSRLGLVPARPLTPEEIEEIEGIKAYWRREEEREERERPAMEAQKRCLDAEEREARRWSWQEPRRSRSPWGNG